MLKSHSIAAALLSMALIPAALSVGHAQANQAKCVIGDKGPAFDRHGSDLHGLRRKGDKFDTNSVLNSHVGEAMQRSKAASKEAGFGFYSSSDCKYVPGKVRINTVSPEGTYDHTEEFANEDRDELAVTYGNSRENWNFVGDAHVHAGNEASQQASVTPGQQRNQDMLPTAEARPANYIGSPSLHDLEDFIDPKNQVFHMAMTIASVKRLKGFDASIVFRKGDFNRRSPDFSDAVEEAASDYKPNSHKSAMRLIEDAYAGSNIAYFSGSFKGKRTDLKGGSFKYRGNP